jgi:hypothetical protein
MRTFLTRTERQISNEMGGFITYYNNLYYVDGSAIVQGRTEDGMYAIYSWQAIEIDPRTKLFFIYDQSTLIEDGDDAGQPVGMIDDATNFFDGVRTKVSLIVPTSPGSEVTI